MSTPDSLDYPNILRMNRLNYCAVILNHLMNRADAPLGEIGKVLHPILARCRSVQIEFLVQYCDALNNVVNQLDRYGDLAESCSRSGAYQAQRITCLEQLKTTILLVESDKEIVQMLHNMHNAGTF
jgi:hypothetical protein